MAHKSKVKTPKTFTSNLESIPNVKRSPSFTNAPQQPLELSEKDKGTFRKWLDGPHKDGPFKVDHAPRADSAPKSKKRKRTNMLEENNIFEDRLSVLFEVKPRDKWELMRKYRKFTVGTDSISAGDYVLIKHEGVAKEDVDQWKAKVLEVRALDPEHVYIRVAWLNRPEDLPDGRKPYHARLELIPSNQMEVIDAMAVNGKLDVMAWDENSDGEMVGDDEYFWRQTYDFVDTKSFTDLRKICIDDAPHNPDELIMQCSNKECRKWMHTKCIAEQAVKRATGEDLTPKSMSPKKRGRKSKTSRDSKSMASASKGDLEVDVFIKGLPNKEENDEPASKSEIIVTNLRDGEQKSEDLCCLFCNEEID